MARITKKRFSVYLYRIIMGFYKPAFYKRFFVVALLISLIACTKDDSDPGEADTPATSPSVSDTSISTEIVEGNEAAGSFQLEAGVTSFQIIARAEGQELRLVTLEAPNGEVIYDVNRLGDLQDSSAGNFQRSPNTFNYPRVESDSLPQPGQYKAVYEVKVPGGGQSAPISPTIDLVTKQDQDLTRGVININIFYSGVVSNSKESRDAVESSLKIVRQILDRANLSLFIEEIDLPSLPEVLPNPYTGDILYDEGSKAIEKGVNIFIATDVSGLRSPENSVAIAGSSPGPVLPSPRSAIAISISKAAGPDGRFDSNSADEDNENRDSVDDSEIRLLAEVIVHELSHYMGLGNTMTFSGGRVVASDNLDSEKCPNINACEENDGANGNIMFPYSLRIENNDEELYYPRDRISTQQIEVIQRYVGVD